MKGGRVGLHPSAGAVADLLDVDAVNLDTPAGWLTVLSAAARQLCRLPTDCKVGNTLAILAGAARTIEQAELSDRLAALESALLPSSPSSTRTPGPHRRTPGTPAMRLPAVYPAARR